MMLAMFAHPACYIPGKKDISKILLGQHFTSTLSKLLLGRKKSPVSVHVGVISSEIRRKSFAYTDLSWVMQWNNFIEVFQSCNSKQKVQNKQDAMVFLTSPRTLDKSDFIPSGEQMSILELLQHPLRTNPMRFKGNPIGRTYKALYSQTLPISGYVKSIMSASLAWQ